MKYLVPCLLVLPLITSCVEQEQYYGRDYYNPAPRVEVQRNSPNHYHNNGYYRPAPQGRVYHGRTDLNRNRVIVNPRVAQGDVEVQQNVHGQGGTNNNNVVRHFPTAGRAVVVPGVGKVHGHNNNNNVHGKSSQPVHAHDDDTQETTHGHN